MLLSSNSITVMDATDSQNLAMELTCNLSKMQTAIITNSGTTYVPSWEDTPLVITPTVYSNGREISLTDKNLTVHWKRKTGGTESNLLTDGSETVKSGVLTVNKNNLASASNDALIYVCYVTYGSTSIQNSAEFTLVFKDGVVDYIAEEGVSGIWEYKKWHNGRVECIGRTNALAELKCTTKIDSCYYDTAHVSFSEALPAGLFKSVKYAGLTVLSDGYLNGNLSALSINEVQYKLSTSYSSTQHNVVAMLQVVGKYK